jgi:hypothetical protein
MVRDGSVVCPGSDAAVIRIKAIPCRRQKRISLLP